MVFALVGHPGHGADPRFNAKPPSNAASKLWRPANGPHRRRLSPYRSMAPRGVTTRCDQRSCQQGGYFYVPVGRGVCPFRVQGTSRGPALPGEMGGPGITGLLGTGPRAMPLRAAPGEKLGAAACAAGTKRNRCCRHPLPALWGACQLGSARTRPSLAAKALAIPGGPSGNSASDSAAAGGQTGRDEPGARMNPNRMGLEEQTQAHALRQGRQPSGLAGGQPRPGRADAPAAGPAPATGGRGALGPAWCLQEITRVAFADVDQGHLADGRRTARTAADSSSDSNTGGSRRSAASCCARAAEVTDAYERL
jgi:hypothetical protein